MGACSIPGRGARIRKALCASTRPFLHVYSSIAGTAPARRGFYSADKSVGYNGPRVIMQTSMTGHALVGPPRTTLASAAHALVPSCSSPLSSSTRAPPCCAFGRAVSGRHLLTRCRHEHSTRPPSSPDNGDPIHQDRVPNTPCASKKNCPILSMNSCSQEKPAAFS